MPQKCDKSSCHACLDPPFARVRWFCRLRVITTEFAAKFELTAAVFDEATAFSRRLASCEKSIKTLKKATDGAGEPYAC